jgi:hypothetical protein
MEGGWLEWRGRAIDREDTMRLLACAALVAAVAVGAPIGASAAGSDPNARATFLGAIHVDGKKATLQVRYRCGSGEHLWVSAKETASGVSAAKLMKEGSSRTAAAWWQSHRNRFACNGKSQAGTFTIDTVERGSKGALVPGSAWVQFCVTKGKTEKTTVLVLSKSGWVRVSTAGA